MGGTNEIDRYNKRDLIRETKVRMHQSENFHMEEVYLNNFMQ